MGGCGCGCAGQPWAVACASAAPKLVSFMRDVVSFLLTHTHTRTHTHTLSLSVTHAHTHTHTHSLSLLSFLSFWLRLFIARCVEPGGSSVLAGHAGNCQSAERVSGALFASSPFCCHLFRSDLFSCSLSSPLVVVHFCLSICLSVCVCVPGLAMLT